MSCWLGGKACSRCVLQTFKLLTVRSSTSVLAARSVHAELPSLAGDCLCRVSLSCSSASLPFVGAEYIFSPLPVAAMPHKHKPAHTAEQLCAAIHRLAAANSEPTGAGHPFSPETVASVDAITPSSVGWLCSSPEMLPLVQRILAMAEQCKQQPDALPAAASTDEREMRSASASIHNRLVRHITS